MYEPVLRDFETRDEFLIRWCQALDTQWTDLTVTEKARIRTHVLSSDFPASVEDMSALASAHGFATGRSLFASPDDLYHLVVFDA